MNCKDYHGYTVWDDGTVIGTRHGNTLKPNFNKNTGYYQLTLYYNGHRKDYQIHRLVAMVFLPNFYGKPTVDHKDHRDKTNNNLYNLKWATYEEQAWNRGMSSRNTSGVNGVSCRKSNNTWIAQIKKSGLKKFKSFKTKEEAISQRLEWEKKYHHI